MLKTKAVIFIVEEMQRDDLKPLKNYNCDRRSERAKKFFEQTLKLEDIEVCKNFSRE